MKGKKAAKHMTQIDTYTYRYTHAHNTHLSFCLLLMVVGDGCFFFLYIVGDGYAPICDAVKPVTAVWFVFLILPL